MTRTSILELAATLRPRCRAASKVLNRRILDEFCATTGYHRKAAIRLFNRQPTVAARRERRGRPRLYHPEIVLMAWEAAGFICAKRPAPFMGAWLDSLTRHHQVQLYGNLYQQLAVLSAPTMNRLPRPVREACLLHPM